MGGILAGIGIVLFSCGLHIVQSSTTDYLYKVFNGNQFYSFLVNLLATLMIILGLILMQEEGGKKK